jgi:hypothetical protein
MLDPCVSDFGGVAIAGFVAWFTLTGNEEGKNGTDYHVPVRLSEKSWMNTPE